jgi:hypothetical protein
MATIQRWPSEAIGDAEDAGIVGEPGWRTDSIVGSETPVLEAEIRLETAISGPAQLSF